MISVIIPTHNRAAFLSRALHSVLAQTYSDFEVIIVDDGSTDNTADMVRACVDSRVHLIQQTKQERAAARNTGVRHAQGDFVAFLDDDDLWAPARLESALRAFDSANVGVVYTGWRYIDEREHLLPQAPYVPEKRGQLLREFLFDCWFPTSAALVRRESIEHAGEFDPALVPVEDWDMWIRIAEHGEEFSFAVEPLLMYRLHEQNSTKTLDRLESSSHTMLEEAFARLGDLYADVRDEAFARLYFHSALRYLGAGEIDTASGLFVRAVSSLPSLLDERQVYYQVICGMQPDGYKGTRERLDLAIGRRYIERFLADSFADRPELDGRRGRAYGNAYSTLAQLHYGKREMPAARRYLKMAASADPALLGGVDLPLQWAKASLPAQVFDLAKSRHARRGR